MSKGIGGIKGYHSGGGVTHTHGSKKNKEKKKALQAMTSNQAYQGSGTSQATQAKKKMGQSYKDMYSDMASVGIKNLSGATTGDKAGKDAQQKQRDAGFKPIADYDQGLYTIGAGDPPPKDDKPPKEDKKEQVKYYDDELGQLSERDLFLLEKKIGQKAIIKNGKIFFVDTTGSVVPAFAMIDKLGGALDKFTGFRPEKSFGSDDPRTAATFAKMFGDMDKKEFEAFLNRKGNLDRIMDYAGGLSPTDNAKLMDLIKDGDPQALADRFMTQGKGLDADKFQSYYDKIANPEKYYSDPKNVPQTTGGLVDLASLDASQFSGDFANQIFAAREELSRQGKNPFTGNAQQSGGGIGNFQTSTPTPPATDTTVPTPDFLLKRQYMPGFTPNYLGGPEQMQIAGGYYDPVTKKFIGNPYGTANQYQFAKGGIVGTSPLLFKNQGGMASDKGIKSFKNYGY